jgi:hypothetical protein
MDSCSAVGGIAWPDSRGPWLPRSVWRLGEESAAVGHDDRHEALGSDQVAQRTLDRGKGSAAQMGRQPPVAYAARRIPRIGEPAQMLQNGGGNGIDAVSVTHGTDRSLGDSRSGPAIAAQLLECTPRARCRNLSVATSYPKNAGIDAGAAAPGRRRGTCANPSRHGCFRPFSRKWGGAASAGQGCPGRPRLDPRWLPARHDPPAACPARAAMPLWLRFDRPSGRRPPGRPEGLQGRAGKAADWTALPAGSGQANAGGVGDQWPIGQRYTPCASGWIARSWSAAPEFGLIAASPRLRCRQ